MGKATVSSGELGLCNLGCALLLAFAFLNVSAAAPALAQGGRAVPVIVYEARTVPYSDRIEALGTLRASERVALTAPVADTITAINFETASASKPVRYWWK